MPSQLASSAAGVPGVQPYCTWPATHTLTPVAAHAPTPQLVALPAKSSSTLPSQSSSTPSQVASLVLPPPPDGAQLFWTWPSTHEVMPMPPQLPQVTPTDT